ncbi:MAG: ribosomal L7Ae/L30e/S12e/Gadd45 family protein, partial [Bacilli bacterium]|nr:ribosomal L7Ae/L30e/S12e/Gadd45 family protein [Bacilli bacterium]
MENKNNEKILNLIGLATRARKTSMGIDVVIGNIQHNKAKLVFIANDASIETIKKVQDKCKYYNVIDCMLFNTDELNQAVGKGNIKVVSINDNGFYTFIKTIVIN